MKDMAIIRDTNGDTVLRLSEDGELIVVVTRVKRLFGLWAVEHHVYLPSSVARKLGDAMAIMANAIDADVAI